MMLIRPSGTGNLAVHKKAVLEGSQIQASSACYKSHTENESADCTTSICSCRVVASDTPT